MSPCKRCSAKCCRYIALEIDEPDTKDEFENIRWYLAHKDTAVFVDDGDWFLEVKTECRYISSDHKCMIYEKRPKVCRDHSAEDCEVDDTVFDYEYYFDCLEDFDDFLATRSKKRRGRPKKKS